MKDKIILITGNGSFANAMIERLLKTEVKKIIVFNRNEFFKVQTERKFKNKRLLCLLADITKYSDMINITAGVDYCIHTAALKHVKACEEQPLPCFETNIFGTANVIEACINNGVEKLVCLSTDKAANPTTTYGVSKLAGERIIAGIDNKDTTITMTRYGNVAGSSGSVIPHFKGLRDKGEALTLTDPEMTRFYIPIEKAVDSVIYALEKGIHKDLVIYKGKSATVQMIADCISDKQVVTGAVKTEKNDEALLTKNELNHSIEDEDFYIVNENYDYIDKFDEPLTSDNAPRYTMEELKELIDGC